MAQTPPSSAATEAPKPKIIGFILERGCGKEFDLYIFFDNNKILKVDESNSPGDDVLKQLLGETKGFTRKFTCGITA